MKCLACGGNLRSPGHDRKNLKNKLFVLRFRKCNCCDAGYETREMFDCITEQTVSGPIRVTKANRCPLCDSKTIVQSTTPINRGEVLRTRKCEKCGTEFGTIERVFLVLVPIEDT
ncbi:hypothetical protein DSCA_30330 [Desulfosarcina alkanivorans]|uniref:Transcriptional regulator NrdR n=1 Tax=Desulfosarcina alkanivorans TaxID=571177 RepID=A0A5K7YKP8_9BACT|nr:hypothetical protein DSCA_30330 [Desulfosarcina alkanivorans]